MKLAEVIATPYGALSASESGLSVPIVNYLVYGVGLALLLLAGAAHLGLTRARRLILSGGRATAVAAAAIVGGVGILVGFGRWVLVGYEGIPVQFAGDRVRFLVVMLVTTTHVPVASLLIVGLGLRIARLRGEPERPAVGRAGAARRR